MFAIQLQVVIEKTKNALALKIAHSLQNNPFMHPGTFFQNLSNQDVEDLKELLETQDYETFTLIATMLAQAEGIDLTTESAQYATRTLEIFVTLESLHRLQLAKALHNNWSFDEQNKDLTIAYPGEF